MQKLPEQKYFWKIDRWLGGLSEDSRIGPGPGAFRFGIGLDFRTDSGFLGVAKKPVRYDDGEIHDEIHWIEEDPSTHDVYYFGGSWIYKEEADTPGVIRRLQQLTEDGTNGQGLGYFDHAMYLRTPTKLVQLDLTTGAIDPDWQTGLNSTRYWGPMCNVKNVMLVGHGRYIGTIDDVQFWNPKALVLPPDYFARSIFRAGSFAIILATYGEKITDSEQGMMFLWDTTSDIYNDFIPIDGNPHAGIAQKNVITIFAGKQTNIQQSVGGQTTIMQGLPLLGDGDTAEIYPGAVASWRNMIHFGISDGNSETVERAIYSYGAKNSQFSDVLNPEFPTSAYEASQAIADLISSGVRITAVKQIGLTLRFACSHNGENWIDQIDLAQQQTTAIFRSLAFDRQSPYEKNPFKNLTELKQKLATGESVQVKVSPDPYGDPDFTDTDNLVSLTENEIDATILELPMTSAENQIRSRDLHMEIRLSGTGATRPAVKRTWSEIMEDQDQI